MLSASCSSAPTRENSHCDIIRKSFISLNFAVLAPTTTTQLSSVSGYSLIHKQWGLWPYFELLSMNFKENMKHDSYCCIQAMTLWQNELSAFMIKIVPFAKLPRLGNDWFHFHSVWAGHQNQWKSLLKWCEKNYTDWVSNQNNKFLRLVDVNLNLIMLVTVFTPSSDPPFCQSHKPSHSSHSSLSGHHHYLSFTSQLKWEIINSKGRNLPLLFKSLKGSPHLLINLSIFLLSVTLRHRQSSVIIWCFGSSVWNLNLKKVLNHGYRMGEVVPTYINGFKTPRNIFVRWLWWCYNDRSSASLCETSFRGQSLINEIKHRDKLRKWGL